MKGTVLLCTDTEYYDLIRVGYLYVIQRNVYANDYPTMVQVENDAGFEKWYPLNHFKIIVKP
jgi:hypothetical protein